METKEIVAKTMEKIMEAESGHKPNNDAKLAKKCKYCKHLGLMIDDTPYYCGYNGDIVEIDDDFECPKPE